MEKKKNVRKMSEVTFYLRQRFPYLVKINNALCILEFQSFSTITLVFYRLRPGLCNKFEIKIQHRSAFVTAHTKLDSARD